MRAGSGGIQRQRFNGLGNLSGCVGWYDGALGATVSQWTDQSGHGSHWVQASVGIQPVMNASSIHGLPGVTFNGTAYSGGPVLGGAKTIVCVYRMNVTLGASAIWSFMSLKNAGTLFLEYILNDHPAYAPNTVVFTDDFNASAAAQGTARVLDTSGHVFIHTYNGSGSATPGNYTERCDGTVETVTTVATDARITTDLGSLGARLSSANATSFPSNVDVTEMYIYNRVLTPFEQVRGRLQMKQKYALP